MKTLLTIALLWILNFNLASQWIWRNTNAGSSQPFNSQFVNPSTGYVLFKIQQNSNSPVYWRIFKTTNKGANWTQITNWYTTDKLSNGDISFINENTGFLTFTDAVYGGTRTMYTSNGGTNWSNPNTYSLAMSTPQIRFINENIGFLFSLGNGKLYKTTNRGSSWEIKYSYENGGIFDLAVSPMDNNKIYLGGHKNGTGQYYNSNPYLVKSEDGFNSSIEILDGTIEPPNMNSILKIFISNVNGTDEVKLGCYRGIKKLLNENGELERIYDYPENMNGWQNYKLELSKENTGFGYWQPEYYSNLIVISTDGGQSWATNYGIFNNPFNYQLKSFGVIGDMCFFPDWDGIIRQKRLTIDFNSNFDWRQNGYNGTIFMNNLDNAGIRNFTTPIQNQYLVGGSSVLSIPESQIFNSDSSARFYYWGGRNGNLSMDPTNNNNYYIMNGSINADYKSKLKSNTINALKDANQVKSLKDTNGVTNLIYESMGGIFYTRTIASNNNAFKSEEVLSGTNGNIYPSSFATFNNSNPFLAEIHGNINSINKERNIVACWERREGDNIKIMISYRKTDPLNSPEWGLNDSITISGVTGDFKCYPKVMISGIYPYDTKVITYLKPVANSSDVKLLASVIRNNTYYPSVELIGPSQIKEYSIISHPILQYSPIFETYLAYRINQEIFYKKIKVGWDGMNSFANTVEPVTSITQNDDAYWRASIDIALKNATNDPNIVKMQPVVTYQGQRNTRITRELEDGSYDQINSVYYPIYIKERLTGGSWSTSIIKYNSLNNIQQLPDIEGSYKDNSCILTYGRIEGSVTKNMIVVPYWNDQFQTHFSDPNYVFSKDARLINGSVISHQSSQLDMLKLEQHDDIYEIEKVPLVISNIPSSPIDGNISGLNGVILNDNIRYTFNLGNIMVNSKNIAFGNMIDTAIQNSNVFNQNMSSSSFLLSNNDTLIIGRNASYIPELPDAEPLEIEYWVKLINTANNQMHKLLAHDTLRTGDSIQIEYLEGFIINQIIGGTDSFFVSLEVDTVSGAFGIGGGKDGEGAGEGDNTTFKRKIFWENDNKMINNNNIPTTFNLYQNFPNPFNPATMIKYDLPKDVKVTIKIYDLLGREVTTLVNNEFKNSGRYELAWNASNYATGVYIYRIEAGDYVSTKKMVLIK